MKIVRIRLVEFFLFFFFLVVSSQNKRVMVKIIFLYHYYFTQITWQCISTLQSDLVNKKKHKKDQELIGLSRQQGGIVMDKNVIFSITQNKNSNKRVMYIFNSHPTKLM
jgi:hypothetical protein